MPSPIGHMLGGIAAGWLANGRSSRAPGPRARASSHWWAWDGAPAFAAVGAAPDLDLLLGTHSTYTHSVGAVAATALVVLALTRGRRPRLALACAAAVASHILLDWLGSDTSPPIGIMALWPFTREFYQSPWFVFDAISRRWWLDEFALHNARALLRELMILCPIVALVGVATGRLARRLPR